MAVGVCDEDDAVGLGRARRYWYDHSYQPPMASGRGLPESSTDEAQPEVGEDGDATEVPHRDQIVADEPGIGRIGVADVHEGRDATGRHVECSRPARTWRTASASSGLPADDDLDQRDPLQFVAYPQDGLQNGPNDGIALVCSGRARQFLSYEGSIGATTGPALALPDDDDI